MTMRFFKKIYPNSTIKKSNIILPNNIRDEEKIEKIDKKEEKEIPVKNNKKKNKNEAMDFNDKIKAAEMTIENMEPAVKVIKQDKGLIERTESSKIIITEDNRQVLID